MNDLGLYDRHAGDWWDDQSHFSASLHALNRVRLGELAPLVTRPGQLVVDLGCGGGLISEPLAQGGARVVGVDLSLPSLREARRHGRLVPGLAYVRADAGRVPLPARCADLVVVADVLEHVVSWRAVLSEAARLVRPTGAIYLSTINRTWRARLIAIMLAEGLGFVPRGTHDYHLLVRPSEVRRAARDCDLQVVHEHGHALRLWPTICSWRLHLAPGSRALWGSYAMVLRPQ